MLAQNISGKLRAIRYVSKAFTETESGWKIQQKELYAIKFALESFRPYVIDKRMKIVTENANLQFLKSVKPQQAKLAHWCLATSEFDFYIERRPGRNNPIPDYLSRHPVSAIADTLRYHSSKVNSFLALAFSLDIPFHTPNFVSLQFSDTHQCLTLACNLENNSIFYNKDCSTILQFKAFSASNISNISNAHSSCTKEMLKTPLNISRLKLFECQQQDPFLSYLINYLKSDCSKSSISNLSVCDQDLILSMASRVKLIDNLLYYSEEFDSRFCVYMPSNPELQKQLIQTYHDSPLGMHRGGDPTYAALSHEYFWKSMSKHVRNWVRHCKHCIRFKSTHPKHSPMHICSYYWYRLCR